MGRIPQPLKYDQNIMRLHLVNAISKQKLLPFPAKLASTGKTTTQFSEGVPLHCVCQQPDDGSKMVQCCKCTEWYHTKCAKIPEDVIDSPEQWSCGKMLTFDYIFSNYYYCCWVTLFDFLTFFSYTDAIKHIMATSQSYSLQ